MKLDISVEWLKSRDNDDDYGNVSGYMTPADRAEIARRRAERLRLEALANEAEVSSPDPDRELVASK
jgi:hypothetical protein